MELIRGRPSPAGAYGLVTPYQWETLTADAGGAIGVFVECPHSVALAAAHPGGWHEWSIEAREACRWPIGDLYYASAWTNAGFSITGDGRPWIEAGASPRQARCFRDLGMGVDHFESDAQHGDADGAVRLALRSDPSLRAGPGRQDAHA